MTRIKVDPTKKPPKEDQDGLPSIFTNKEMVAQIAREVAIADPAMSAYASEHVMRGVVHLASLAVPDHVIARSLNIPKRRVALILKSESIKREIERIQTEYYKRDCEQMFGRLVPAAVQTIFDLMTAKKGKESVRLDSAKYLVDRALGKPKELIETKTDMISEVFAALQKPKSTSKEDILDTQFEQIETVETLEADPLEDLLGEKS